MAKNEKFIQSELKRLERQIAPNEYCFAGKTIKFIYGPASTQFSKHVDSCGQCSQALEWEEGGTRQ